MSARVAAVSSPTQLDDTDLLRAVLAQDARAWRELVRRHESALRDAVRESADGELADDDVDDILGDFWLFLLEDDLRRLRAFGGSDLLGWLSILIGQVASNRMRKAARQPRMEPLDEAKLPAPPAIPQLLTTAAATAYCGFKTSSALRKAHMEGRIKPAGRRGGRGTWMWRRDDLDHFLVGKDGGTVTGGRSGAPTGGTHGSKVGAPLEVLDRAKTGEAWRVAHEGRRLLHSGTRDRSSNGAAARDQQA